jgi:hypothetical protein
LISIVQRRRRQPAAANGDRHADMHRLRRLEFGLAIEPVEGGKAARSQGRRLDRERRDHQPAVGRPGHVPSRQPLLARRHIDLMLEIVVRDFSLRSRHRSGNGRSHRAKVERWRSFSFRWSGGLTEMAFLA